MGKIKLNATPTRIIIEKLNNQESIILFCEFLQFFQQNIDVSSVRNLGTGRQLIGTDRWELVFAKRPLITCCYIRIYNIVMTFI